MDISEIPCLTHTPRKGSSSQPGEGLPAKAHLVLDKRIYQVNATAALQSPLPQPSKELHGVISALGNAQGLCPELETPGSRLPQHNTQGNPGKSSPVPSRAPACPAQVPPAPQASDCCGAGFPGLPHSLSGYSRSSPRSQPGPVPPAAVTISLLTPQPHWKHRQEQTTSRPGRAGGASKAMTGTVAVVGTRLPWYKHGGGAASTA